MAPVTDRIPKPLLPLAGMTVIERLLRILQSCQIYNIRIGVGWKGPLLRRAISRVSLDLSITIVDVPNYEIGPLQTLVSSIPIVTKSPVLICPSDYVVSQQIIRATMDAHYSESPLATLAVSPFGKAPVFGRKTVLCGIGNPVIPSSTVGFSAMCLAAQPEFLEYCKRGLNSGFTRISQVINNLIQDGVQIQYIRVNAPWYDIDTPSILLQAMHYVLDSMTETIPGSIRLFKGDSLHVGNDLKMQCGTILGKNSQIIGPTFIAPGCEIGPFCTIGPYVCIESGTTIPTHSKIQHSLLLNNSKLKKSTILDKTIVYFHDILFAGE